MTPFGIKLENFFYYECYRSLNNWHIHFNDHRNSNNCFSLTAFVQVNFWILWKTLHKNHKMTIYLYLTSLLSRKWISDFKAVPNFSFFTKQCPSKKYEKWSLFCLKSLFHSQDNHSFVFSSFLHVSPVSHCLTRWSKKNIKLYGIINWLNKNLKQYIVRHFEKERRSDMEIWSIYRELNKERFHGKSIQKICTPKNSLRPLSNIG